MGVYIQDVGIINGLGHDKLSVLKQLLLNQTLGHKVLSPLISGATATVCQVTSELPNIDGELSQYQCRYNQMLLQSYLQIAEQVDAAKAKYGAERIAIILGTTASGTADGENMRADMPSGHDLPDNYHYEIEEVNSGADFLAAYSGIKGISYTVSTACTSSGKAMIAAKRMLENGLYDAVIVGGADTLSKMTINGFDCLDSVDADVTQPFSLNRKGINLGEGAALMLLSKEPAEIALLGGGESSDAYHISSPDPQATGAITAMRQALQEANLQPSDIGYINLHGTGTPLNDSMESIAVAEVLSEQVACSSFKPLIGHTLGAASIQELALCWLMLSSHNPDQVIPAHVSDHAKDPELRDINLLTQTTRISTPYMMSNSFAFGGSNVSLVIGKANAS